MTQTASGESPRGTAARVFPEKLTPLTREVETSSIQIRKEGDTTKLTFSLSSEAPVERWFGKEILSHEKGAIRMERIKRGAMPLLFNHDWNDPVGMIDDARVEDKRLVVDAHLFNTERAQEVRSMLDGGLRNVSVGYRLHVVEEDKDEETYTARDWEPYEGSIVTVPADHSVGVGRDLGQELEVRMLRASPPVHQPAQSANRSAAMSDKDAAAAGAIADQKAEVRVEAGKQQQMPVDPTQFENERVEFIRDIVKGNNLDERYAQRWISSGATALQVGKELMAVLKKRSEDANSVGFLDMSRTEKKRYSLLRALRAAINGNWDAEAGLELEASNAVGKRMEKMPRSAKSFFVPLDIMMNEIPGRRALAMSGVQQRDMTVAGVSGSNYLVGTDNLPGSFIDLLRNSSVGLSMGVQRLSGLKGNVTIPKMTAGNTAYWLADETTQITESQPTIGQLALAPKNVAALTELSHQLMTQSTPDAESLVLQSIARDIGLAVDVGILRGSGSAGQPTGIATTGSIGAFTGTSLAAPGVLNAVADVGAANALFPGCGFATTHAVAALLMDRPNVTSATDGTPLWQGRMEDGTIRGYRAMASGQMAAGTMLFGWWPSVVLAEWGVLELMVNPFSDFTRGLTAVRGWYTCDVGVRYAGAWSYASSIT